MELLLHETLQFVIYQKKIKPQQNNPTLDDTPAPNSQPSSIKLLEHGNLPSSAQSPPGSPFVPPIKTETANPLSSNGVNPLSYQTKHLCSVISYLQHFDAYPTVMVRCARKMDSEVWPLLFYHADKPSDLFTVCSCIFLH